MAHLEAKADLTVAEADEPPSGALARGLHLLTALNDLETATIAGLVEETGLPKPTLIRLLRTLVDEGYAAHSEETSTYGVTSRVASLSRALIGRDVEGARVQAVLDVLADRTKWPTEFLAPEGTSMVIRATNRERAPIRLRLFERRRFPMGASAAGVAHMAAMDGSVRDRMLATLGLVLRERGAVEAWIARAGEDGFADRALDELGPNMRVAAVAVPGGCGALSLVYFDDVVPAEELRARLLPALNDAACRISEALDAGHPARQSAR